MSGAPAALGSTRWCSVAPLLGLLMGVAGGPAGAAARARDGGTLRLALLPEVRADRAGETPEGAVVLGLFASPPCRLDATGRPAALLASLQRTPEGLNVVPRPGARFRSGAPLGAPELARAWIRAMERSPVARAALSPVRDAAVTLAEQGRAPGAVLALPLAHSWPDLEVALCHPALTPMETDREGQGIGPYVADGPERGKASPLFPEGRPHPDALLLSTLSRRAAQRALEGRGAQALLGDGGDPSAPALFATYVVSRPASQPLLGVLGSRLDRAALVRSFVGGPSAPMPGLLPPVLGGARSGASAAPARGSGTALLLHADRPAQRAVAERLQILLRDAGVQLTLAARSAEALDRDWRAGQGDLALRSVLLPPLPAPALAVVLELAGDVAAQQRELAALGAVTDPAERASRARERALKLAATLPVLPLHVEALRTRLDPALIDARRDGLGLLVLDDAWWP